MPVDVLVCLGLNHLTAPIEVRERIQAAMGSEPFDVEALEWALLSTCNRLEFYCVLATDSASEPERAMRDRLAVLGDQEPEAIEAQFYAHRGAAAARHLCRVATGLDSQILGESEVLRQVSEAHERAVAAGTIGPCLRSLFRCALRAGKRARNETGIGRHAASVSSVAVALAEARAGDLRQRRILLVGLGKMGVLGLKSLRGRGVRDITLINRTDERAATLVTEHGLRTLPWGRLDQAIAEADVVLTATSSPSTVIDSAMVSRAMSSRAERSLMIIDMAVPRDVAADVAELPGVCLFNVDDLNASVDDALLLRRGEVGLVEAIVEEELECLARDLQALSVRPVIAELRRKAERIRERELRRTLRYLGEGLDPDAAAHIQHLSRALVNQLLHEPTTQLRRMASGGGSDVDAYATALRELFGLDDEGGAAG